MKAEFPRRLFLAFGALLGGGSLYLLGRGLLTFFSAPGSPDPPSRFPVADPAELSRLKDPWKYHQGVWLIRDSRGWYALLGRCTHLGCRPALDPSSGLLVCPCHGSRFDLQGRVVKGPAERPLPRLELARGSDRKIWVDTGKETGASFRLPL
ncbi:MAG: ubiquinol-cytochrome c reductase iron-sulfur subunit [Deltaproteobacteria bacterium]|nr:ubiquinol-cytochrome c reductase iron-sulfur subunit [Deltaproteobacteria bacterium]